MNIILETTTGHVIISEVDALVYVLLSKAEKHMPYGEFVCTRESMMLQMRCHTNQGHHNQVQLYLCFYTNICKLTCLYLLKKKLLPFSTRNLADGPLGMLAIHMYKSRFSRPSNKMHLLQFFISHI